MPLVLQLGLTFLIIIGGGYVSGFFWEAMTAGSGSRDLMSVRGVPTSAYPGLSAHPDPLSLCPQPA